MRLKYKSILKKISAEMNEAQRKGLEVEAVVLNQHEAAELRKEVGACAYLQFPVMERIDPDPCKGCMAQKSECNYCKVPLGWKPDHVPFKVMGVKVEIETLRS